MEELNKNTIGKTILRIINECNELKAKEKLELIYNRLNSKNSLEKHGLIQRLKSTIYRLNPKYRKESEIEKMKTALKEIEEVVSEHILTDKIFQHKVLKDYSSELGSAINVFMDLHFGVVFNEEDNSLKRYEIKLTDNIKRVAHSEVLRQMQQIYISRDISLNELIKKTEEKYRQKAETIKK